MVQAGTLFGYLAAFVTIVLALGMGILGLVMAALNYLVATLASTDVWLFYTTFVDFFLVMLMVLVVFSYARGRLFPRRAKADEA